jgi:RHS repeat-associated protein
LEVNGFVLGSPIPTTCPRGIDYIYKKFKQSGSSTWNTTAEQFPLYDGHGNMVATLSRDGSSFVVNNRRTYDVWGGVRNETSLDNAPNTKYCANLGHKEDDESGLIYMRARYYEPWTGRFISEDNAKDGWNWYVYAHNSPINFIDASGNEGIASYLLFMMGALAGLVSWSLAGMMDTIGALKFAQFSVMLFMFSFASDKYLEGGPRSPSMTIGVFAFNTLMNGSLLKYLPLLKNVGWLHGVLGVAIQGVQTSARSHADPVLMVVYGYILLLSGALVAMEVVD